MTTKIVSVSVYPILFVFFWLVKFEKEKKEGSFKKKKKKKKTQLCCIDHYA